MNARAMTLPSRAPASAVAVTALAPVAAPWPLRGTSSVVHPRTDADFAMERYAGGDTAAFGQLYDALSPRLFGYLLRQTRDRARAEDLLQQTMLQIHRARDPGVSSLDRADDLVHAGELAVRVQHILARLPHSQRAAFELIKQEGLTVAEAAQVLGT